MSKPKQFQDSAHLPIEDTDWGLQTEVDIDFAGGGSIGAHTLFSITGTVLLRVLAVCVTSLTGGSATIEAGIDGDTAKLIAQTTGTDLDIGEIWHDNAPDAKIELSSVLKENIVSDDVVLTIATADLTAGRIKFVAYWYPLTVGAKVTAIKGNVVNAYSSSESASVSQSPSASPSSSESPSASPSSSTSSSNSPSESPSASASPSSSDSSSESPSASPSSSTSPSSSESGSASPSSSESSSESHSPSPSSSASPSASTSESLSASPSSSESPSSSVSPSV